MRVEHEDGEAETLELPHGFAAVAVSAAEHEVGMKRDDRLERRGERQADAGLLLRFERVESVVGDGNDFCARAESVDIISNAGDEADDALRMIGNVDDTAE